MTLATARLGWIAAALLAGAVGCAAAHDPLYGARPLPPLAPPRIWAQPPYPQALVVTEPLPVAATQEAPPIIDPPPNPPEADPATDTPAAPPAAERVSADPLAAERARNEAAFERDYLRQKERLFDAHVGHWVAIVDGRLLPADARGRLAPAPLLADALAAADAANREALHRFVFRIGEEGDVVYPDPLGTPQALVGVGFKLNLGITSTFDPAAPAVLWTRAGKSRRFSVERDQIELRLADPTGRQLLAARVADSSGYGGFVLLDAAPADLLDAERFEVPGRVVLERGDTLRELRRSRLRVQIPELEVDELVPAAIWFE